MASFLENGPRSAPISFGTKDFLNGSRYCSWWSVLKDIVLSPRMTQAQSLGRCVN